MPEPAPEGPTADSVSRGPGLTLPAGLAQGALSNARHAVVPIHMRLAAGFALVRRASEYEMIGRVVICRVPGRFAILIVCSTILSAPIVVGVRVLPSTFGPSSA